MAILKNVSLWFPKLDPKRPNKRFTPDNPTWDLQIRTENKEVKKEWEAMGLSVKAVVPDEGNPYFRVNLKKKTIKADGTLAGPVEVFDGAKNPINPNTIGNGSVGNVRVFQYEYPKADGTKGLAPVLMAVQVTRHLLFEMKINPEEEFDETETEVVAPEPSPGGEAPF